MSYNCENVFDTCHDEGHDDYEYLSGGVRRWSRSRLYHKLKNIGKVVMAADTVRPVDVVCLLEVENDTVMTWLTTRTPLRNLGYRYVMTDSDDPRGIDVALMYSPFTFRPVEVRSIRPDAGVRTRDILFVSGVVCSGDTLDFYALHLPSKLNGFQSDVIRAVIMRQVCADVDSVMRVRTKSNIIIMGDFNTSASSAVFSKVMGVSSAGIGENYMPYSLYNLMAGRKEGSYKYRNQWSVIDHIIVSGNLLIESSSIHTSYASSGILSFPFLLEKDAANGGMRPKRTYRGFKYSGGFSDHLPVIARFVVDCKR
ncbi:MAG: endonuclease [Bacteroides sp.]|nr:endonuclease [Bacteroides sp.]